MAISITERIPATRSTPFPSGLRNRPETFVWVHSKLEQRCRLQDTGLYFREFTGKASVIFVCVKGYSIESIAGLLQKAAHRDTLIIPVLNVYGTDDKIQTMVNKYRKYMKRTKQLIPNIRIKPCPLPPHTTTPQQQPKHSTKQFSQKPVFLPFHRKSGDYRKKYRNPHLQSR